MCRLQAGDEQKFYYHPKGKSIFKPFSPENIEASSLLPLIISVTSAGVHRNLLWEYAPLPAHPMLSVIWLNRKSGLPVIGFSLFILNINF